MRKKYTYFDIKKHFEDNGCELLTLQKDYKNVTSKVSYRCVCGNFSEIMVFAFRRGDRCQKCRSSGNSERFRHSQEEAAQKFLDIGFELLDIYKGSGVKVKFKCQCGNISEGLPNNVWKRKSCYKCALDGRSKENHYLWRSDREAMKLEYKFKDHCHKLITMVLDKIGKTKNNNTLKLLGYNYNTLQEHITNHSNWESVKDKKWHIDHIFPIKAFVDLGILDLKIINALDNLQPLFAEENCSKGSKYDKVEFYKWLKNKGLGCET